MWVNGGNSHLMISSKHLNTGSKHLNTGDKTDIYLDIIHELVRVEQLMEGKELFDSHYGYTERPTEVDAYSCAIDEARNIGLSDKRICQYLRTEWMNDHDFKTLARILNIDCGS